MRSGNRAWGRICVLYDHVQYFLYYWLQKKIKIAGIISAYVYASRGIRTWEGSFKMSSGKKLPLITFVADSLALNCGFRQPVN